MFAALISIISIQIYQYEQRIDEIGIMIGQMSRVIDEFELWSHQQQFEAQPHLFQDPFGQSPEQNPQHPSDTLEETIGSQSI